MSRFCPQLNSARVLLNIGRLRGEKLKPLIGVGLTQRLSARDKSIDAAVQLSLAAGGFAQHLIDGRVTGLKRHRLKNIDGRVKLPGGHKRLRLANGLRRQLAQRRFALRFLRIAQQGSNLRTVSAVD